jgi:hypothetical protein
MHTNQIYNSYKCQEILAQIPSHQRLNVGHPDGFANWLAGFTDGDGCFWFGITQKGSWDFVFKISQSNYNLKLLGYLKKKLHCGSVISAGKNMSQYCLRHPYLLYFFLIPLIDSSYLLTRSKAWDYLCFKEALSVYWDSFLSIDERNRCLVLIKEKQKKIPETFCPDFFSEKNRVLPKGWVLGFTEAEGSFYLVQKTQMRIVHGIGWSQKFEKELLECLGLTLKIHAKVKKHSKYNQVWILESTASASVEFCIKYFEKKMKGMKAMEIRKWARSYRKNKGNFEKLTKLQSQLRRAKRLDS